jgi:hypothetical protein
MPKVLFAVDEPQGLRDRARFLRHLDTLRVMGKLQDLPRLAVGHWVDPEGISWLEPSYLMDHKDFEAHVLSSGWCNEQQSFLVVEAERCQLVGNPLSAKHREYIYDLGPFRCVGKTMPSGNWTRFDDTGEYWVAGDAA